MEKDIVKEIADIQKRIEKLKEVEQKENKENEENEDSQILWPSLAIQVTGD